MLIAAPAGAGGWAYHRWTHPTLFEDAGDGFRWSPLPVGSHFDFGGTFPDEHRTTEVVHIEQVAATVAEDSAHSRFRYVVCRLRKGEETIDTSSNADTRKLCPDQRPFVPGMAFRYGPGAGTDYLLVSIIPTRAGETRVMGVRIDYERGRAAFHQHGWQDVLTDRVAVAR